MSRRELSAWPRRTVPGRPGRIRFPMAIGEVGRNTIADWSFDTHLYQDGSTDFGMTAIADEQHDEESFGLERRCHHSNPYSDSGEPRGCWCLTIVHYNRNITVIWRLPWISRLQNWPKQ